MGNLSEVSLNSEKIYMIRRLLPTSNKDTPQEEERQA
jgi:hypothetical protein